MLTNISFLGRIPSTLTIGIVATNLLQQTLAWSAMEPVFDLVRKIAPQAMAWARGGLDEATFSFLVLSWIVGSTIIALAKVANYRDKHDKMVEIQYIDNPKKKLNLLRRLFFKPAFDIEFRENFGPELAKATYELDSSTLAWEKWERTDYSRCVEMAYFKVTKTNWVRSELSKLEYASHVATGVAFLFFATGAIEIVQSFPLMISALANGGNSLAFSINHFFLGLFLAFFVGLYAFRVKSYLSVREVNTVLSRFILSTKLKKVGKKGKKESKNLALPSTVAANV